MMPPAIINAIVSVISVGVAGVEAKGTTMLGAGLYKEGLSNIQNKKVTFVTTETYKNNAAEGENLPCDCDP
jgi:hypothetical protein